MPRKSSRPAKKQTVSSSTAHLVRSNSVKSGRLTATRRTFLKVGASRFWQECPKRSACRRQDTRSSSEIAENSACESVFLRGSLNSLPSLSRCFRVFSNLLRVAVKQRGLRPQPKVPAGFAVASKTLPACLAGESASAPIVIGRGGFILRFSARFM